MFMLYLLGFIWTLPISIITWIIMGLAELSLEIEKVTVNKNGIFVWDLKNTGFLYRKVFIKRGFWGFSSGNNVIVVDTDFKRYGRTIKHETKHCFQQYALGIFYFPVYLLIYLYTYLFGGKDKHPYYDHPFEKSARKAAGQIVNIPRKEWSQGPVDRNIFW